MTYLIPGLGNIGCCYQHTRHNIGFSVVDQLAQQLKGSFNHNRFAHIAHVTYKGKNIYLLKPTTYMNHSGRAVHYWLHQLRIPIEKSFTIVDDIALPFGVLRTRTQGSSGGHNGLKSLEAWLHTQAYPRLRFGVGNNFHKGQQADYVLSAFTEAEQGQLPDLIEQCCEIVLAFCTRGMQQAIGQQQALPKVTTSSTS